MSKKASAQMVDLEVSMNDTLDQVFSEGIQVGFQQTIDEDVPEHLIDLINMLESQAKGQDT